MYRRQFLSGLAGTSSALLLASCTDQQTPRQVVYASGFSLPKSIDEALWLEFEARVERELPDHDVRLLIRGETGPEETSFSALRRGRLQFVGGSFAGVANLVPEIALLSLPFFFDSVEEVDFVMDRYMLEPFRELFAVKGLRVLHWTDIGWVSLYSKAPLKRPSDARGVRIRASTSIASQAFIAEIGADMVTMPFSDVLPALQTGLIDAGVTSITMYTLSGIAKVAPNYTLTRHSYDMGVAMASEKWFQSLSLEEQAVYSQGLGDVQDARRRVRASVNVWLEKLGEQGVHIHDPEPDEREAWRTAARASHEKLIRQIGGASRRIYETLLEGRDAWKRTQSAARLLSFPLWSACLLFGSLMFNGSANAANDVLAGQRIYESACVVCHGQAGRADPQDPVVQALGVLPADFSDALFSSREPADDWRLVVKYGGAALGLSELMPAHEATLSDQEIADVVGYIKSLADTRGYPPGEFNLFLALRTRKAFPEDEIVWKSRYTVRDGRDVRRDVLELEKRIGKAGQALLEVIHEDDGLTSGVKAVQVGYKHAFNWDLERGHIWSAALLLEMPTVGNGKPVLIPQLAYGKFLPSDLLLQASARALLPSDRIDEGSLEFASAVHWAWSAWPRRVFPGIEVTASVPLSDNPVRSVQWTAIPQLRWGLTRGGHVALNLGVEIPLGNQDYERRYHLNLLWDFADGSFFDGW